MRFVMISPLVRDCAKRRVEDGPDFAAAIEKGKSARVRFCCRIRRSRRGCRTVGRIPNSRRAIAYGRIRASLTDIRTIGSEDDGYITFMKENVMVTRTTSTSSTQGKHGAAIVGKGHTTAAGPGPEVMDAATLIGDKVVNANDEHLDKIEAIMLDVQSGRN